MATSFVTYRNEGFWAYDDAIRVVALVLLNELEKHNQDGTFAQMINTWAEVALPNCIGCLDLRLDDLLPDDVKRDILVGTIEDVIEKITTDSTYLTSDTFNKYHRHAYEIVYSENAEAEYRKHGSEYKWTQGNLSQQVYLKPFQILKQLLEETFKNPDTHRYFYWH